jgi:hypothetical protein
MPAPAPVTLRLAAASDADHLDRLAQLDSRRPPREGRIDAAISLSTGETVADPFRRTAELCELLRLHARSRRVDRKVRRADGARPRPALAPT